jgi:pimeloyl-ACP methyl ester carboxylesterase
MPYVPLPHAGRIHYAERGERRPATPSAVFVHGAGASSAIWMMVLARVARAVHAIAIDLPGHGPSGADGVALDGSRDLTLARHRDALGELCGALCLAPSILVGHSMGALVAIEAARRWPDKVRGLVLCGAGARLPVDPALGAILRDRPADAPHWLAEHAFSPRAKPSLKKAFLAAAGEIAPLDVIRADYRVVEETDATAAIAEIRCPIVWIDGADDRIVLPSAGRAGEVITVSGAGHLLPIEAPGAIAEATLAAVAPD